MKDNLNHTARIIAGICFVIGTVFLSLYLYYGEHVVNILLAFFFIILALITNTVMLTVLFGKALRNNISRTETLKTILIMLCNIPIAILYFYMIITF